MLIGLSWQEARDPLLTLAAPVVTYWLLSLFFEFVDWLKVPWLEKHRIRPLKDESRNLVSRSTVVKTVILQQIIQTVLGILVLDPDSEFKSRYSWPWKLFLMLAGFVIIDTWQFWLHRLAHENKWLYRNMHSWHHRIYVPYAFGALYNHPLEAFLLDTISGALAIEITQMDSYTALWTISLATAKTVLDHSGYCFPVNPAYGLFPNNALYHALHHEPKCIKYNYSQPFFTWWDYWAGSYVNPQSVADIDEFIQRDKKTQ